MTMTTRLWITAACLAALACGKEKAAQDPGKPLTPTAPGQVAPAPPAPTPAPAPGGAPAGWQPYDSAEYGFKVMAPGTPNEINLDQAEQSLKLRGFQFMLGTDGMGQVMYAEYTGNEPFDLEAGLDGACKESVAGMNGTMGKYEKVQDKGRSARDFDFKASAEGFQLEGYGKGIAIAPKTVLAVIAMHQAGKPAADAMSRQFMANFEAK
jgi:hypothetical protein